MWRPGVYQSKGGSRLQVREWLSPHQRSRLLSRLLSLQDSLPIFSNVSPFSLPIFIPEVVTALLLIIDYSCGPLVATHNSEMSSFGHKGTLIGLDLSGPPVPYGTAPAEIQR